ncbi:MAG TPA: tRNA preQ1(34) S-adenosylmethionine ribosyltransferase-isomerase QueA [Candidatus Limnocylindria bacterium]|nr:tRNA preQ1(34) S-adenosylmethionine ribosyltransferase-isomerase QueA [Candidatus Limnocylindria bacterium]
MDVAELHYELPPHLIAQTPAEARDSARLLVVERHGDGLVDRTFADLPDLLRAGDCLVVNDSRVIPARVMAQAAGSGAPVELLFVEPAEDGRWRSMVKPGRRCRPGAVLRVGGEGGARLRVAGVAGDGARLIERLDPGTVEALMEAHGVVPLPPYITRHDKPGPEDGERYQTVYARVPGSIAAPTAGLHFTPGLMGRLRTRGIEVHAVTLHVGPATFRPMKHPLVEAHVLPAERAMVPAATARAVSAAKTEGRRVIAVGTTATRTLESAADGAGVRAMDGAAEVFITPGHRFRVVDGLVTNFHLPRTTLLVLAAAFAGRARLLAAYAHAVRAGYRFYSYGDAMLIL